VAEHMLSQADWHGETNAQGCVLGLTADERRQCFGHGLDGKGGARL
jgi:hypothetical protein